MAVTIKLKWCRVVCRRNMFVCNGVTIYDGCLYATLEEDVWPPIGRFCKSVHKQAGVRAV